MKYGNEYILFSYFQLSAIWTAAPMANVTLENVDVTQVGRDQNANNYLVTVDVKNTVNAEMVLVSARRDGTDATVPYVSKTN